jgi:hypothetical protein
MPDKHPALDKVEEVPTIVASGLKKGVTEPYYVIVSHV